MGRGIHEAFKRHVATRPMKGESRRVYPIRNFVCAQCGIAFQRGGKPHSGRAFCSPACGMRAAQRLKWADPVARFMRSWKPVECNNPLRVQGPCWQWKGSANPSGHPRFTVDGVRTYAYRYAFETYHERPVGSRLRLHHRCFNPSCVNPLHLVEMTQSEHLTLHKRRIKAELEWDQESMRHANHMSRLG